MKKNVLNLSLALAMIFMLASQGCKEDDPLKPSTVADFDYVMSNGSFAPTEVTFTDKSANAIGYSWDFGNGETSTEQNPSVVYTTPGTYEVTLTVTPKEVLHYNKLIKTRTVVVKDPFAGPLKTLYFTDRTTKSVRYITLDGKAPVIQDFGHTGLDKPYGIVIDTINDQVFVSDYTTSMIYRYSLDGMGLTTILNSTTFAQLNAPMGLFIWSGKLYWAQEGGIYRCNLDGTSPEAWIPMSTTSAPEMPVQMAFDPDAQIIYFTNDKYDYSGGVYRVNLDGTGLTLLVTGTDGGGIGLDKAAGKIYYADYEKGMCMANLDGTGEVVINSDLKSKFIWGLVVNKSEGKLYWGNRTTKVIARSNLDGSNIEDFATNVNSHGMALDKAR